MKKTIMIIVVNLLLISSCFSQQGWYVVCGTQPSGTLRDLFFINSQTGWITQDSGKLIKTTNGGINWIQYNSGTAYHLYSIKFLNALTGWAAGGLVYPNPFSLEYAVIVKTTNGGINWVTQYYDSFGPHFNTIAVANENYVFATANGTDQSGMAAYGLMKKTTNGGTGWSSESVVSGVALTSVHFLNSQTGWCCGFTQMDVPPTRRYIYRTTNSGISWTMIYKDSIFAFSPVFNRIQFPDANTGYITFSSSLLKKTTNGGNNWNILDSVNTYGLSNIFFISKDTGWVCKNPIKRTNNGGLNWSNQTSPNETQKLFFINSLTGWAIGNSPRVILKTTTGGVTFINQIANNIPDEYSLSQNYPNPFNPTTRIQFSIPALLSFQHAPGWNPVVILKVFDLTGREIQLLVNEKLNPGTYEVTFDGSNYASGVYFYQLRVEDPTRRTGEYSETKKLVLLK